MTPIGASAAGPLSRREAAPPPPPPPTPVAGAFGLVGNPAFDPDEPTLNDLTPLTGAALDTWAGIRWLIGTGYSQFNARSYIEQGGSDLTELCLRDNLYMYSRPLATKAAELANCLRVFGWLRFLDVWAEMHRLQATQLATGYRNWVAGKVRLPRHNYRCWVQGTNSGNADTEWQGADYHPLDNIRCHEPIAHLLYALRQNQHLDSPTGVKHPGTGAASTYEAVADWWEAYFREWVKIWQGAEQALGYSAAGTSGGSAVSGWGANYRGQWNAYYHGGSMDASPKRAGVSGQALWPVQSRHHTHTHVGASALHYWLGRAIPDFSEAATVGLHGITELMIRRNTYYWDDAPGGYGQLGLWPRSLNDVGHGTFDAPIGNYPEPSGYNGYIAMNLVSVWLDGALPAFPELWARPVARAFNRHMYRGLSTSQGMHIDTLAQGSLTGSRAPVRADGRALDIKSSAGQSGSSVNPRSNSNLVSSGITQLLPWDTSDDHAETHIWDRMGRSSSFYDGSDPLAQPQVLGPSLGLVMKQMGAGTWSIDGSA